MREASTRRKKHAPQINILYSEALEGYRQLCTYYALRRVIVRPPNHNGDVNNSAPTLSFTPIHLRPRTHGRTRRVPIDAVPCANAVQRTSAESVGLWRSSSIWCSNNTTAARGAKTTARE